MRLMQLIYLKISMRKEMSNLKTRDFYKTVLRYAFKYVVDVRKHPGLHCPIYKLEIPEYILDKNGGEGDKTIYTMTYKLDKIKENLIVQFFYDPITDVITGQLVYYDVIMHKQTYKVKYNYYNYNDMLDVLAHIELASEYLVSGFNTKEQTIAKFIAYFNIGDRQDILMECSSKEMLFNVDEDFWLTEDMAVMNCDITFSDNKED